jgi:hypothetical protein
MKFAKSVLLMMAIILKANKVNLFVSSVFFVFWYHSPTFLNTPRKLKLQPNQHGRTREATFVATTIDHGLSRKSYTSSLRISPSVVGLDLSAEQLITPKMLCRMSQRTWRRIRLCVQHQCARTDSLDM